MEEIGFNLTVTVMFISETTKRTKRILIDSEVLYLFFALTVKYAATLKQASTIELLNSRERN